jgi:hypothetical protein
VFVDLPLFSFLPRSATSCCSPMSFGPI